MKNSTKIWLAIAGILLIALGIVCICNPGATLIATAWLIGCLTLCAGIARLIFTFRTQTFLPNSGSRTLIAILEIVLGLIFICNNLFVTAALPFVFAIWILVEGIVIAVQSFDYKQVGYSSWWVILILGILGALLGILCLYNPIATAATLSVLIGLGVIALGVAYLLAVFGISKFEKKFNDIKKSLDADEQ